MKIADVFNEKSKEYYRQENASEYAYITADEYSSEEVIDMEKKILTLLDFNCFSPTVPHFLKLYYRIIKASEKIRILCDYIADLTLLSTKILQFKPSLVASTILLISCEALGHEVSPSEIETCHKLFNWYNNEELSDCVRVVKRGWSDIKNSTSSKHDAVNTKFENQQIIDVKNIAIPTLKIVKLEQWFYESNDAMLM